MIEIEAKIRHPGAILDLGRIIHENLVVPRRYILKTEPLVFTMEDRYLYDSKGATVRFRKEHFASLVTDLSSLKYLITIKEKTMVDGVEINKEDEREISEKETARLIEDYSHRGFEDLGYIKTKTGMCYQFTNDITINAEAVFAIQNTEIYSVGHYFEVEQILPDTSSQEQIQDARKHVLKTLEALGLDTTQIESRSWKVLCAEALLKEENKYHERKSN
jgi:adenylate cyclase class IV